MMAQIRNQVSPQAAAQLVEMAKQMRQLVFGKDGAPEWVTKFTHMEGESMAVGLELARLMMPQATADQAPLVPEESLKTSEEPTALIGQADAALETPAGKIAWRQPKARLSNAR